MERNIIVYMEYLCQYKNLDTDKELIQRTPRKLHIKLLI